MSKHVRIAVGAFAAVLLASSAAALAADSARFFKVSPRGTWLAVDPDDVASPPTAIQLSQFGVEAGDFLAFRPRGAFKAGFGEGFEDDRTGLIAVFRKGTKLVAPGPQYPPDPADTQPTCSNNVPTDIAEDFAMFPEDDWFVAQVPQGATDIAFGSDDCYRNDNTDPNKDYGVEIATFPEVMKKSVTLVSTPTAIYGTFAPNFGVPLREAAHLGGYDHFNWLRAVTEIVARTAGVAGRMTKMRCVYDPVGRQLCDGISDKRGKVPLPSSRSQRVFFIDPIYGGFKSQVDQFGRPFPVRDSRPWHLDEAFGPEGQRSGPTELETRSTNDAMTIFIPPNPPPGVSFESVLALAGVHDKTEGDLLLLKKATVIWSFPPRAGENIRLRPLREIPAPISQSLSKLGVSVRSVPVGDQMTKR